MSAFDLNNDQDYNSWRDAKLDSYPKRVDQLLVEVEDINNLSASEHHALVEQCKKTNAVIYRSREPLITKNSLDDICATFGLQHLDKNLYADDDGISALRVSPQKRQFEYIPYSDKSIKWHTDGYYNQLEHKIRAMVLHCANPAQSSPAPPARPH